MAPTRPGAASFHLRANTDTPATPNRKQAGWAWQRRPPAARLPFAGARRRHAAAAAARHGEIEWPQPALAPPPSIPKQHLHIACPEPGLASQGRPRCWPWCLWAPPWCTSRRWLWLWLCGHACGRHRVWRAMTGASRSSRVSSRSHKQRTNNARTAHEQRTNSVRTACKQRVRTRTQQATLI